jgi:acyl carrier protein
MNDQSQSTSATQPSPDTTAVPAYLERLWEELLRVPHVAPDDLFFSLGGDSVLVVEMLVTIQSHFDQEFEFGKFFPQPNLRTLSSLIEEQLQPQHDH